MSREKDFTLDEVICQDGVLTFKRTEVIHLDGPELELYNDIKSELARLSPEARERIKDLYIMSGQLMFIGDEFFPVKVEKTLYGLLYDLHTQVLVEKYVE